MVRMCEKNIIFLCVHQSVRPSSAHLSVTPSPPTSLGGIQPNATSLPLMARVCESNIFACVRRPFVCPSCYLLLNHQVEFNQTCYITSPHGKGVREQHYLFCPFGIRASVIRPSVINSPEARKYFSQSVIFSSKGTVFLYFTVFLRISTILNCPRYVPLCISNKYSFRL